MKIFNPEDITLVIYNYSFASDEFKDNFKFKELKENKIKD